MSNNTNSRKNPYRGALITIAVLVVIAIIVLLLRGCDGSPLNNLSIAGNAFPVITAGGSIPLTYFAKVSGDAPNVSGVEAAHVVFTISITN